MFRQVGAHRRSGCAGCGRLRLERGRVLAQGRAQGRVPLFQSQERRRLDASLRRSQPRWRSRMGQQIPYVENIAENATQITPPAENFIQRGYNVIIGTAFGYSDTFKELAAKYPDVAFLNAAGTTNGANLQSFYGRTYESQYLCGMAAGAHVEVRQARLRRRQSVRHRQLDGQRLRDGRQADQSEGDTDRGLHRRLERSGQGARRRRSARRAGHRRHRPACRHRRRCRSSRRRSGIYGTGHHRDLREFAPKATHVLVGLGVGQVISSRRSRRSPAATGQPARTATSSPSRTAAPTSPAAAPTVPKDVRRQGHGRAPGDHRRQARLRRPAQGSRRQGARRRRAGLATAICGRWTGTFTA